MDILLVYNGLGNQMSQYAFYKQKKHISESTYFIQFCNDHNGFELNRVFNINCKESIIHKILYLIFRLLLTNRFPLITKPIQKLLGNLNCKIVYENFDYRFKEKYLIKSKYITFYYGGWHSEKYFISVKEELEKKFQFNKPIDVDNVNYIKDISAKNSVSIHVRRGDFLNRDNINLFGDVCNRAYYETAIDLIKTKVNQPHFFIFSNDMEWVMENIKIDNVTYITCNTGENSWKDMYLMSICKYNIIANSTFSWWGAWLNKYENKIVISPSRFLKNDIRTDVYPDSWIKLEDY